MIERFETLLLGVAAAAVLLGVALSLARGSALRAVLRFDGPFHNSPAYRDYRNQGPPGHRILLRSQTPPGRPR